MLSYTMRLIEFIRKKAINAYETSETNSINISINTEKITENTTEIEFASESIENIMTETLPTQNATLDEVADAIETIMTQILPSLMADNE